MILLFLSLSASAAGLLYDADSTVPLAAYDASVLVSGRIMEVSARFSFPSPGEGARTFAAVLPLDAAVTGLRYREGEGAWVEAGAVLASEVEAQAGPEGDPRDLLDGQVFVATLPALLGEDVQIELGWQRLLAAESGALSASVPLDDGGLNGSDPAVTLDFRVEDPALDSAALEPEGALDTDGAGASGSWSGTLREADAVTLTWTVAAPALGVTLWTYRPAVDPFTGAEGDAGYALLVLQPGSSAEGASDQLFTFVLDTSASMAGDRLETAVIAGSLWLDNLTSNDLFNLVPYQSIALPFRSRARAATEDAVADGARYLEGQEARGLSDPAEALTEALDLEHDTLLQKGLFSCGGTARESDSAPPLEDAPVRSLDDAPEPAAYIVWLTDGGASTGETDPWSIAAQVSAANAPNAGIYALAVGPDADLDLMRAVTGTNRGELRQAEDADEVPAALDALQDRTRHPLLVRPVVQIEGAWDQAPEALQDASEGYELLLAFRWDSAGEAEALLTGTRGAEAISERFPLSFPETDEALPPVARAWAQLTVRDLDARYAAGETALYSQIQSLVETYGVASEVVTFGYGGEGGDLALAEETGGAGCGCGALGLRARAALGPGLLLTALALARRRAPRP